MSPATKVPEIYLNNRCFHRSFGNRAYINTRIESKIQEKIKNKVLLLAWPHILNSKNALPIKGKTILERKALSFIDVQVTPDVITLSSNLLQRKPQPKDTLHVARAIGSHCDYFITTDDQIVDKLSSIKGTKILDPIEFIKQSIKIVLR